MTINVKQAGKILFLWSTLMICHVSVCLAKTSGCPDGVNVAQQDGAENYLELNVEGGSEKHRFLCMSLGQVGCTSTAPCSDEQNLSLDEVGVSPAVQEENHSDMPAPYPGQRFIGKYGQCVCTARSWAREAALYFFEHQKSRDVTWNSVLVDKCELSQYQRLSKLAF